MPRNRHIDVIARDCVFFRGNRPCLPHRRRSATCRCEAYSTWTKKALVVGISSPVGVIHSTALLQRLKSDDPNCHISYLSPYLEFLPSLVDEPLNPDAGNVLRVQMEPFDILYNLDMDKRACAITNVVQADLKKGFYLRRGQCVPLDEDSQPSYMRAIMPKTCSGDQPDSVRQMFQLCGLEYRREVPRLEVKSRHVDLPDFDNPVVALATTTQEQVEPVVGWDERSWITLADKLRDQGIIPLLLGGAQTDRLNRLVCHHSQAEYLSPVGLGELAATINACAAVVSFSPLEVEIALALGKEAVLVDPAGMASVGCEALQDRYCLLQSRDHACRDGIPLEMVFEAVLERITHVAQREEQMAPAEPALGTNSNLDTVRGQASQWRRSPG